MKKFVNSFIVCLLVFFSFALEAAAQQPLSGFCQNCAEHQKNPKEPPLSAYALLNRAPSNAVIAKDSHDSVLLGLYYAAEGKTAETFDKRTGEMVVFCSLLQDVESYVNEVMAISRSPFQGRFKNAYGGLATFLNRSIDRNWINTMINEKIGIQNAVESVPADPEAVMLISVCRQRTFWEKRMEESNISWNDSKRVPGFSGKVEVSTAKAPNDATVYHLKMAGGVVMSVVFVDELDKNGIGEWLPNSYKDASSATERVVGLPKIELEQDLDYKNVKAFEFLFDRNATLIFGDSEMYLDSARQKCRLVLNERGLDAVAVTYATAISKGLVFPPRPELCFNKPFVAAFSYVVENGGETEVMPTFLVKVVDPQVEKEIDD